MPECKLFSVLATSVLAFISHCIIMYECLCVSACYLNICICRSTSDTLSRSALLGCVSALFACMWSLFLHACGSLHKALEQHLCDKLFGSSPCARDSTTAFWLSELAHVFWVLNRPRCAHLHAVWGLGSRRPAPQLVADSMRTWVYLASYPMRSARIRLPGGQGDHRVRCVFPDRG